MEKCLVIDFDDTLVKTIEIHADSWRKALEKVLNIEISLDAIMADINYGMDVLLEKYQLTPKESKLAQKYKKQIFSKNLHKTKVNELRDKNLNDRLDYAKKIKAEEERLSQAKPVFRI